VCNSETLSSIHAYSFYDIVKNLIFFITIFQGSCDKEKIVTRVTC